MANASVADKERLAARYRLAGLDVMKVAEQAATGSDFGVSGYTTVAQAEQLACRLRLGPDDVMLDLGSGTGWPGLHLAKLVGCSVVVSDPVGEGPRAALARAESEDIAGRAWAVPADGRALPFASASFEAVVHSDVICWIRQKLSVLRECRRVLRPDGVLAFHAIEPAAGLDLSTRRKAHRAGPPAVAVRTSYPSLLHTAGFRDVEVTDLTAEYLATVRRLVAAREEHFDEMAEVLGVDDVRERIDNGHRTAGAIAEGLLVRAQYVAAR